jgi:hypothetical protein
MLVVREVLHCHPGKVKELLGKFKALNAVMQKMGVKPFRLLTDLAGERFWTLVLETETASVNDFLEMEGRVMSTEEARKSMAGYQELILDGRREIYRVEA